MSYLLDTNVLSESRKPTPDAGLTEWLTSVSTEDLFVSVITIGEIRRGISKLQRRNDFRQASRYEAWLATTTEVFSSRLVPITAAIAEEWGHQDASRPTATVDGLIAATAKVHGLTMVTRNTKDFDHTGVRLLNPFTA